MKRLLAAFLLCVWALLASAAPAAEGLVPLPVLKSRVTDLTGTLAVEQMQQLESRLAEFEAKKGSQVAVLLLPTTQPEAIEQFGIRLAEAWKVGRKNVDDGVIVIVAKDDRALRIEVGYGLEGALNDATAKRIVSEIMVPALKQGDYFGALQNGVASVTGVIEGEPLPPAVQGQTGTSNGLPGGISENIFLVGLAAVAIGGAIVRFFLGNLLGSAVVGGLTGVAGWWLIGSVVGAAIGGIGGFLLAMFGFDLLLSILLNSGNSRGGRGGGGGGSWGGGGGGFGGGGASGRW